MPPATPIQTTFPTPAALWERVLASLREETTPQVFETWLLPLRPLALEDGMFVLEAPHAFLRDWVEENYLSTLRWTVESLAGSPFEVQLRVAPEAPALPAAAPALPTEASAKAGAVPAERPAPVAPAAASADNGTACQLNPKYTFDNFVVGPGNQVAHAAARASADQPGRSYNPLFIYGGSGLGKTHLMHAIAHQVQVQNPGFRIGFVSSERFLIDFTNHIRWGKMEQFRDMYRKMDVLLVDDIQFIAGKGGLMEEFFHTFNTLYDAHRQIVLSSDKLPSEIDALEDRLRSRFEWGLIADIQPPDLETKVAILEKKAQSQGMAFPKENALYLAQNSGSNIRILEGYLTRLVAFAAIRNTRTISMELIMEALGNFLEQKKKAVTAEMIQKAVVKHYDVKMSDLFSKKKNKEYILPRHLAMYLCRQLTALSLPDIGRQFGGRDHTTVIHALNKMETAVAQDPELAKVVAALTRQLQE